MFSLILFVFLNCLLDEVKVVVYHVFDVVNLFLQDFKILYDLLVGQLGGVANLFKYLSQFVLLVVFAS